MSNNMWNFSEVRALIFLPAALFHTVKELLTMLRVGVTAIALLLVTLAAAGKEAAGSFPETYYNYVTVNATYGAKMFYGIRGDSNSTFRADPRTPLVIWLQGGPGATSQFGNFLENGPQKLIIDATAPGGYRLVEREHRWTKHANMLYIDNPVGTGFSYVENPMGYTTTDEQIGDELVEFLRGFIAKHQEYKQRDLWIFCESYGGKMTAYFGAALAKAQLFPTTAMPVNFKGVSIGDGWVDPIACMQSYPDYLYGVSQITDGQRAKASHYADLAQDSLEEGHGFDATNYWGEQQDYIMEKTNNVNFYNILYYYDYTADNQLNTFLSTNFTQENMAVLNASYPYNAQSNTVFSTLGNTFMRDGVSQIETLIDLGYSVNVESGQLDLIVDTLCIQRWMSKLSWSGLPKFLEAKDRQPIFPGGHDNGQNTGGFYQRYQNFTFWQIDKAGHMIPLDNPAMAETMFVMIIGGDMSKVNPQNPPEVSSFPKGKEGKIHLRPHRRFRP